MNPSTRSGLFILYITSSLVTITTFTMDDAAQLKALENQSQELKTRQDALQKEFTELANFMGPDDEFTEREPEPRLAQLWQEIANMKSQQEALREQINQKKDAIERKK